MVLVQRKTRLNHEDRTLHRPFPHLLHVVPVDDDAALDGVPQGQSGSPALGFLAHIADLLVRLSSRTMPTHKHTSSELTQSVRLRFMLVLVGQQWTEKRPEGRRLLQNRP